MAVVSGVYCRDMASHWHRDYYDDYNSILQTPKAQLVAQGLKMVLELQRDT